VIFGSRNVSPRSFHDNLTPSPCGRGPGRGASHDRYSRLALRPSPETAISLASAFSQGERGARKKTSKINDLTEKQSHEPRYRRTRDRGGRTRRRRVSSSSAARRGSFKLFEPALGQDGPHGRSVVMLKPGQYGPEPPSCFLVEGRLDPDLDRRGRVDRQPRVDRPDRLPGRPCRFLLLLLTVLFANLSPRPWPRPGARRRPTASARTRADTPAIKLDSADAPGRPDRLVDQAPVGRLRPRSRPGR